jgi:hypothetical protein
VQELAAPPAPCDDDSLHNVYGSTVLNERPFHLTPDQSTRVSTKIYPRTYRASGFWSIALYLSSAVAVAGGVAGVVYSIVGHFHEASGRIVMACLCAAFAGLGGYLILWLLLSRTVLFPDRIDFRGVFSTKTFTREELDGWRVVRTSPPTLVLQQKEGRRFKTSLVFRIDDDLSDWFDSIPCLDERETAASEARVHAEIQKYARFGITPSEKLETLQKARKTAKILSVVSTIAFFWGAIYPRPYEVLILLLAILPWIGIEVMRRSHGLFRADELKNDAHPTVAYALIFPGLVLCLRAVLDYNVVQSMFAVALYVLAGGVLFIAILIFDPTQRSRFGILPVFFLFGIAYGYGVIVEANALLDRSPGIPYTAIVQNKRIIHGKSTTYRLDLSPWGPRPGTNEFDVSHATYTEIQTGQSVQLELKKGALNLRWYYLRDW